MSLRGSASIFLVGFLLLSASCGNNRRFDVAAWQQADARERGRMAQNLVDSRVLIGKNVDEARRILGKADADYGKVLSYKINLGWAFKSPDSYGLQVHLDDNRNVAKVKIVD